MDNNGIQIMPQYEVIPREEKFKTVRIFSKTWNLMLQGINDISHKPTFKLKK